MIRVKKTVLAVTVAAAVITSCKKDKDPIIIIPPSSGSTLTLNGLVGSESGSSAGNSVFVDLSTDKQTAVARASWDLGFYCGSEFRVIINNTTSAMAAILTSRTSLNDVVASDTAGLNLSFTYSAADYDRIDDIKGDLSKTVIAAISATDADNKVYVLNCGTGGGTPARDWYKIRIIRNGASGYTLQYAKLLAGSTVSTINVSKDAEYNFKYVHLVSGAVDVEPAKELWDFKWSYTLSETAFAPGSYIPYAFSDFITINQKGGVTAAEVLTSAVAYDSYTTSNIATTTFSSSPDVIGGNWRTASATAGASGVKTDRFYVLKDSKGNVYKLKFLSFHGDDGGTRGKPKFEYKLVE